MLSGPHEPGDGMHREGDAAPGLRRLSGGQEPTLLNAQAELDRVWRLPGPLALRSAREHRGRPRVRRLIASTCRVARADISQPFDIAVRRHACGVDVEPEDERFAPSHSGRFSGRSLAPAC
jgi:hypothetical protein